MANALWFVTNNTLHNDLKIPYVLVLAKIRKFCNQYLQRLSDHVNSWAISLLNDSDEICRLKRIMFLIYPLETNETINVLMIKYCSTNKPFSSQFSFYDVDLDKDQ